jgi:CheY-like chemotaxis protein
MKPLSILVVDDDPPTLRVLQLWLEVHGHHVVGAASGKQALAVIESRDIDLVITDVLMPDGDGIELIGRLKRLRPHLRVLAISGGGAHMTSATCLQRAYRAGAHALLLKPFKQDQLLNAMRYVIGVDLVGESRAAPAEGRNRDQVRLFAGMAGDLRPEPVELRSREAP